MREAGRGSEERGWVDRRSEKGWDGMGWDGGRGVGSRRSEEECDRMRGKERGGSEVGGGVCGVQGHTTTAVDGWKCFKIRSASSIAFGTVQLPESESP